MLYIVVNGKNDTLKALKNYVNNIFLHGLPNKFNIIEDEMNSRVQSTTFKLLCFFFNGRSANFICRKSFETYTKD